MDLDTDDQVLQTVANGGDMDSAKWPGLLSRLIPRLEKIVSEEFPIPKLPDAPHKKPSSPPHSPSQPGSPSVASTEPLNSSFNQTRTDSSISVEKETTPPTDGDNKVAEPRGLAALPPAILTLLNSITQTLRNDFCEYPPHTIQRLTELILAPRQHYRSLTSYLHALDRVVHVTSGANTYPLPPAIPDPASASILSNGINPADPESVSWGNMSSVPRASLPGSDESLGGALLTPIPWLKAASSAGSNTPRGALSNHSDSVEREVKTESTETIEGPHGVGSIETVSVSVNGISSATASAVTNGITDPGIREVVSLRAEGGVTQGELLRQEQKAGVVPVVHLPSVKNDAEGEEEEVPHARGPDEIGMEDMGPQHHPTGVASHTPQGYGMHGIDVEAAVGRRAEGHESGSDSEGEEMKFEHREQASILSQGLRMKRKSPEDGLDNGDSKRLRSDAGDVVQERKEEVEAAKKEDDEKEESGIKDAEVKAEAETEIKPDQAGEDAVMVDADGRAEDEPKVGEQGETAGSDAIDTTGV